MKKFKGSSGGEKSSSPAKRKHDSPGTNKGVFKSKEYISDDDSSDSEKGSKKKVAKVCPPQFVGCWFSFLKSRNLFGQVQDKSVEKSPKDAKTSSKKDDDEEAEGDDDDDEEGESEAESTGEDSD